MRKSILFLVACFCSMSQVTHAVYQVEIKDENDPELHQIARHLSTSHGQTVGKDWEIDKSKTTYFSRAYDNSTRKLREDYLTNEEMEKELSTDGASNSIKVVRLSQNEIQCKIQKVTREDEGNYFSTSTHIKTIILHVAEVLKSL